MKRKIVQWVLAMAVVLATGAASVAQARPRPAPKENWVSLDRFIRTSMKAWHVPGAAVAIVQGKSVVFMKGFGVRDIRTGAPVTPDTIFDIGSCTKAFTAAAIAMLVDEGKMRWDGRVRDYIPFFRLYDPLADEQVTIRDLLTHRTGVGGTDLLWYGAPYTREEIVRRMAYAKPDAGFRAKFQYQNVMYMVAGYAVGQVTGGTWDQFIQKRIFDPLGMTDSDTSAEAAQQSPNFSAPHFEQPSGKVVAIPWRNLDDIAPAGAINSSARDMAKWIMLQLNDGIYDGKRLVSAESMHQMHSPQMVIRGNKGMREEFFPDAKLLSYGMGWFIEDYRGHELILHPGDIDGFSTMVALIPGENTGFVVLVNLGNTYRQVLAYHIADQLLGLPETDWSAHFQALREKAELARRKQVDAWWANRAKGTHPSRDLAAYAGTYRNKLYGRAQITVEDGKLVLNYHGFTSRLEHLQYDTFVTDLSLMGAGRVTFTLDAEGNVARFAVGGIRFRREQTKAKSAEN